MARYRFGVNIMKLTRGIGFMKHRVSLILFVIDNCLIILLSIYNHKSYYVKNSIHPTRKSHINYNDKEDQNKSLIDEG